MSSSDHHARLRADFLALAAGAAALGTGLLSYAHFVEPNHLDIHPVELTLKRLPRAFDGFRIAQFSDLHMEIWQNWPVLERVIEATNAFAPDIVAITGDFVDQEVEPVADRLADTLSQLRPREATLAVVGNHDYWGEVKDVRRMIQRSGIIELNNDVYTIERGGSALHFGGVASMLEAHARLDRVLDRLPDDASPAILLAHEPDYMYISAAARRFDLQLSGHTHGGQVRLPVLTRLALPTFGRKLVAGLGKKRGMMVYTNRGLGMSGQQIRFNCPPELTLFTLCAPEA